MNFSNLISFLGSLCEIVLKRSSLRIKWVYKTFKWHTRKRKKSVSEGDNAKVLCFFLLHSLLLFRCGAAWEYNMLLCDGRGCSCSVSITFRNRKNKMYHEEDYFCETSIQLCNSKCFKSTSDLWHVCIYQASFEALPTAGCAVLHSVSHLLVLKVFLLLTSTRNFGLAVST